MSLNLQNERIYLAGRTGMVGQAVLRALLNNHVPYSSILTHRFDLCNQAATDTFFSINNPTVVIFAAARVGGIGANSTDLGGFLYDNVMIAANAINAARKIGSVKRFIFLGSSCIYPKTAKQPTPESELLAGSLEETNEGYALAKIVGVKLCQYYRTGEMVAHTLMPCNLYGPGDNYHLENSHVLASMIRRFHEAKESGAKTVTIWGSGKPLREFMHVDDLASAIIHASTLDNPPDMMNVGSGDEISIIDLAKMVAGIIGYNGDIITDTSRPDGVKQKLIDSSRIRSTGWAPKITLPNGIRETYDCYLEERQCGLLRSK